MRERWELHGSELFRWKEEDGRWWRQHVSLDEMALLAQNRAVQASGGARMFDWGRMALRFTEAQWHVLCKRFPGLVHGDGQEKSRIFERIARDPDYRGNQVGKW
jgi:hypothetical protein